MNVGRYLELPPEVKEYDPRYAQAAQLVAGGLEGLMPGVRVEHIGSTAVPGCAGKGIVDLMLIYKEGMLETVKRALDEMGFQHQSTRDPFPEDRPMRLGSIEFDETVFRVHIHVISADSPEADGLRRFRDRLRADSVLRDAYVARKREIILAGVVDSVDYCIKKGSFVSRTLEAPGKD
jgi:GrpB-like predicted nucleotidyltransferase (UPF0157 family)